MMSCCHFQANTFRVGQNVGGDQEGIKIVIWSTVANMAQCAFVLLDRLTKRPSDDLATACYIFQNCVMWYFQLAACQADWALMTRCCWIKRKTGECDTGAQQTDGWIHQVSFEASFDSQLRGGSESEVGWVKTRCSESGGRLFWSGLLTIVTCAQGDLSRRRLEMHKQLWRLLFPFYFSLLLTLSTNNSTVEH